MSPSRVPLAWSSKCARILEWEPHPRAVAGGWQGQVETGQKTRAGARGGGDRSRWCCRLAWARVRHPLVYQAGVGRGWKPHQCDVLAVASRPNGRAGWRAGGGGDAIWWEEWGEDDVGRVCLGAVAGRRCDAYPCAEGVGDQRKLVRGGGPGARQMYPAGRIGMVMTGKPTFLMGNSTINGHFQ